MPPRRRDIPFGQTPEPLLLLAGSGHQVVGRDYFYDARLRTDVPHITLQLTLAGTGFFTRQGTRQLLPPGKAFIEQIPSAFEYGYATESSGPYDLLFISMAGTPARRWMQRIHRRFGRVLDLSPVGGTANLMRAMMDTPASLDRYTQSALLYALLMQIFSELTGSQMRLDPRVSRAIEIIDARAGDPRFGVAELAAEVECSREHLTRQFRLATGQSPQAYLIERRLKLAATALRQGPEKIDVIARRCGFSGANYLIRAFQRRWRITPARYRETPSLTVLP